MSNYFYQIQRNTGLFYEMATTKDGFEAAKFYGSCLVKHFASNKKIYAVAILVFGIAAQLYKKKRDYIWGKVEIFKFDHSESLLFGGREKTIQRGLNAKKITKLVAEGVSPEVLFHFVLNSGVEIQNGDDESEISDWLFELTKSDSDKNFIDLASKVHKGYDRLKVRKISQEDHLVEKVIRVVAGYALLVNQATSVQFSERTNWELWKVQQVPRTILTAISTLFVLIVLNLGMKVATAALMKSKYLTGAIEWSKANILTKRVAFSLVGVFLLLRYLSRKVPVQGLKNLVRQFDEGVIPDLGLETLQPQPFEKAIDAINGRNHIWFKKPKRTGNELPIFESLAACVANQRYGASRKSITLHLFNLPSFLDGQYNQESVDFRRLLDSLSGVPHPCLLIDLADLSLGDKNRAMCNTILSRLRIEINKKNPKVQIIFCGDGEDEKNEIFEGLFKGENTVEVDWPSLDKREHAQTFFRKLVGRVNPNNRVVSEDHLEFLLDAVEQDPMLHHVYDILYRRFKYVFQALPKIQDDKKIADAKLQNAIERRNHLLRKLSTSKDVAFAKKILFLEHVFIPLLQEEIDEKLKGVNHKYHLEEMVNELSKKEGRFISSALPDEKKRIRGLVDSLEEELNGQRNLIKLVLEAIVLHRSDPARSAPASIFMPGDSGTGKTHMAKIVAEKVWKEGFKLNSGVFPGENAFQTFSIEKYDHYKKLEKELSHTILQWNGMGIYVMDECDKNKKIFSQALNLLGGSDITVHKVQMSIRDIILFFPNNFSVDPTQEEDEEEKVESVKEKFEKNFESGVGKAMLDRCSSIVSFEPTSNEQFIKIAKDRLKQRIRKIEQIYSIQLSFDKEEFTEFIYSNFLSTNHSTKTNIQKIECQLFIYC